MLQWQDLPKGITNKKKKQRSISIPPHSWNDVYLEQMDWYYTHLVKYAMLLWINKANEHVVEVGLLIFFYITTEHFHFQNMVPNRLCMHKKHHQFARWSFWYYYSPSWRIKNIFITGQCLEYTVLLYINNLAEFNIACKYSELLHVREYLLSFEDFPFHSKQVDVYKIVFKSTTLPLIKLLTFNLCHTHAVHQLMLPLRYK